MIRRILVALDADSDTPVAVQHAVAIAQAHDAEITGIAVVDMGNIAAESRGGGIGSMYYAERLRTQLTEETRARAQQLIREFEAMVETTGVRYRTAVEEGVPFERIKEDMKYHDILIVGNDPHFFYGHPGQRTQTLARLVEETVSATLVVGTEYRDVKRVLLAYDGSSSAARAMRRFTQLKPFGTELTVEVLHVHDGGDDESQLLLKLVQEYMAAHGYAVTLTSRHGDNAGEAIIEHAKATAADAVIAGGHAVSAIRRFAFGSTTQTLLEHCSIPMLLDS